MPAVKRYRPESEFHIDEGCYITEFTTSADDTACSIARARVPKGVRTRWHRLRDTVERYVVIRGRGDVEVGDAAAVTVRPMDVVVIPAGAVQRISNTGRSDLVFLCICTPAFSPDCYADCQSEHN